MSSFNCRTGSILLLVAAIGGCSQQERDASNNTSASSSDVHMEAAPAAPAARAPGIDIKAAPGVAFSYGYAFVLPDKRIAEVQEQHAAACEKLGPTRCRIIGMRYTLQDDDQVSGELSFKLAPDIARGFGKEGIAAVERAAGKLVEARIDGTDVGSQITESQRRSAQLRAELTRIEQQLAAGDLEDEERAELQAQAARLRAQLQGESTTRVEGEEMLAQTPMRFAYAGDKGFSFGADPFEDAGNTAWSSFTTMVSVVLLVIGAALPWALLLALLLLLWRTGPVRRLWAWVRGRPRALAPAGSAASLSPGDADRSGDSSAASP